MIQKKANHLDASTFLHNEETTLPSAVTDSKPRYKKVQYITCIDSMPLLVFVPSRDTFTKQSYPIRYHIHLSSFEKRNDTFFSKQTRRRKKIPAHELNTIFSTVRKDHELQTDSYLSSFYSNETNKRWVRQGRTKDREERGKKKEKGKEGGAS